MGLTHIMERSGSGQNGMDNLQEELANKDATITSLVEKLKKAEEVGISPSAQAPFFFDDNDE